MKNIMYFNSGRQAKIIWYRSNSTHVLKWSTKYGFQLLIVFETQWTYLFSNLKKYLVSHLKLSIQYSFVNINFWDTYSTFKFCFNLNTWFSMYCSISSPITNLSIGLSQFTGTLYLLSYNNSNRLIFNVDLYPLL